MTMLPTTTHVSVSASEATAIEGGEGFMGRSGSHEVGAAKAGVQSTMRTLPPVKLRPAAVTRIGVEREVYGVPDSR